MANKYSYSFAPRAYQDLEDALRYIEKDLFNPKAAQDLAVKLFDKIDTIREFPESGFKLENEFISDQSLRRLVVDNYVLFYKTDNDKMQIVIVRIVYGKRNLDDIMIKM